MRALVASTSRASSCASIVPRKMITLPPLNALEWLAGSAADLTRDLQIGLLIQPNCPGCHIHALPLANELYLESSRDFDLYVVSTAFEDFEYNTVESAKALVQDGKLVGVSKHRLGEVAPAIPVMPVAHDIVVAKSEASSSLIELALEATKDNARKQMGQRVPSDVLEAALEQLDPGALPHKIAHIFHSVRALGTPTWYANTRDGLILDRKFGHVTRQELFSWVEQLKKD